MSGGFNDSDEISGYFYDANNGPTASCARSGACVPLRTSQPPGVALRAILLTVGEVLGFCTVLVAERIPHRRKEDEPVSGDGSQRLRVLVGERVLEVQR